MKFSLEKLRLERKKAVLTANKVEESAKRKGLKGLDQSAISQKETGKTPFSIQDLEFLAELYTGEKDLSIFFDFDGTETVLKETQSEVEIELKKWIDRYGKLSDSYLQLKSEHDKAKELLKELEGLEGKELSGLG